MAAVEQQRACQFRNASSKELQIRNGCVVAAEHRVWGNRCRRLRLRWGGRPGSGGLRGSSPHAAVLGYLFKHTECCKQLTKSAPPAVYPAGHARVDAL